MKVLFVVPYPPGRAASQRFRVEQWLPVLREQGIFYSIAPFWGTSAWQVLYKRGHYLQKLTGLLLGFLRRGLLLFRLPFFDFIFIHREASPLGPPWFEWLSAKAFAKKIIFDIDDAVWLPNTSASNKLAAPFKWHGKTAHICSWSNKVACGNAYLQQYARRYNPAASYLPTVVDTLHHHNRCKQQQAELVTIGWTGSHATLPYLHLVAPVLQRLEEKYAFRFVVIADQTPELPLRTLVFKPWRRETEIEDLLEFDIGLMPLPDTEWAKGKCAFKALQYMALGIPAVVSAVGANLTAVPDGVAGFTCSTAQEWYERLEELLQSPELRTQLGTAGRDWVGQHYALQEHRQHFLSLFT